MIEINTPQLHLFIDRDAARELLADMDASKIPSLHTYPTTDALYFALRDALREAPPALPK